MEENLGKGRGRGKDPLYQKARKEDNQRELLQALGSTEQTASQSHRRQDRDRKDLSKWFKTHGSPADLEVEGPAGQQITPGLFPLNKAYGDPGCSTGLRWLLAGKHRALRGSWVAWATVSIQHYETRPTSPEV